MKAVVAVLLFAFPMLASAGSTGWITLPNGSVQIITDSANPRVFIYVTVPDGGCANSNPQLVMDSSNPLANAMYATLLSAKAAGQTVNITTSGCSALGFPMVNSIYLGG